MPASMKLHRGFSFHANLNKSTRDCHVKQRRCHCDLRTGQNIKSPQLKSPTIIRTSSCHSHVLLLSAPPPHNAARLATYDYDLPRLTLILSVSSDNSSTSAQPGGEPWRREFSQEVEGVSKAGLRALRTQIDEGAPASKTAGTLVNDIIVDGQELLTTEVNRSFMALCLVLCKTRNCNGDMILTGSYPQVVQQ